MKKTYTYKTKNEQKNLRESNLNGHKFIEIKNEQKKLIETKIEKI